MEGLALQKLLRADRLRDRATIAKEPMKWDGVSSSAKKSPYSPSRAIDDYARTFEQLASQKCGMFYVYYADVLFGHTQGV